MSDSARIEIRESRKSVWLGRVAGWLMRGWSKLLRYEIEDRCGVCTPGNGVEPVIFALWHNRIFVMPPVWYRSGGNQRKSVVLTSASKDGSILAHAMGVFGIGAVRGSSSRRAVAALIGMKRALKEGLDVSITPDGPRGPRYVFHPGVVKLAESSGAAIVPIHIRFSSAWRLKTWDRFVLPKPFSRVHVVFDDFIRIPKGLDEVAFEAERERVEKILLEGTDDQTF